MERCRECLCDDCTLENESQYPLDCEAQDLFIQEAVRLLKEQEPKTGRWIFESRYNDIWSNICSECGRLMTTATGTYANYCSNCGAKMMGGEKKDDID